MKIHSNIKDISKGEVIKVMERIKKTTNTSRNYVSNQFMKNADILCRSNIRQGNCKLLVKDQPIKFQLIETSKGLQILNPVIVDKIFEII